MGDKTAVLNKEKYDLLVGKIDMMFVDGVITRKNNSIFKDKLKHLFNIHGNLCDHFVDKYILSDVVFQKEFSLTNVFDSFSKRDGEQFLNVPSIRLCFKKVDDEHEHKLYVSLSGNYISELPVRYYIDDTHVANIDVKNIKTIRMLVRRIVGQKLYND